MFPQNQCSQWFWQPSPSRRRKRLCWNIQVPEWSYGNIQNTKGPEETSIQRRYFADASSTSTASRLTKIMDRVLPPENHQYSRQQSHIQRLRQFLLLTFLNPVILSGTQILAAKYRYCCSDGIKRTHANCLIRIPAVNPDT